MKSFNLLIFLLHGLTFVHSIAPNPNPYFITSDYGVSQGPIYLRGNMISSWEEDDEGFTVMPTVNRTYHYAQQDAVSGELVVTALPIRKKINGVLVGSSPLALGITRHEQSSQVVQNQKCGDFCTTANGRGRELRNLVSTTGTLKNLIVLFKFSDHATRTLPSVSDISTIMNHPGDGVNIAYDALAPTGSVRLVLCHVLNYCDTEIYRSAICLHHSNSFLQRTLYQEFLWAVTY